MDCLFFLSGKKNNAVPDSFSNKKSSVNAAEGQHHTTKHYIFADALNVFACFAVVLLHTSLNVYIPAPTAGWLEAVGIQAFAIFAVPIFFMLSGMNLMGYRDKYSSGVFFHKRFLKIGKAIVGGSILCYIIFCAFPLEFYGASQYHFSLVDFASRFMTNSINDTYWFLYDIIYLYILSPILSLASKNKRILEYILVLCLGISVGIPLMERFGLSSKYFANLFHWPLFTSVSLLYFVGGFYIENYLEKKKVYTWLCLLIFFLSSGLMFYLGLWSNGYHKDSGLNVTYDNYFVGTTSPLCVVQAFSLFILFRNLEDVLRFFPARSQALIKSLSGASLGVYLFHILVINWIGVHSIPGPFVLFFVDPIVRAISVYVLTLVVVLAFQKVWSGAKDLFANR